MGFGYLEGVKPEAVEILKAIFPNRCVLRKRQAELRTLDLRRGKKGRALKSVDAHEGVRRIGGSAQGRVPACLGIALGIPAGTGTIDGITRRAFRKTLALVTDIQGHHHDSIAVETPRE